VDTDVPLRLMVVPASGLSFSSKILPLIIFVCANPSARNSLNKSSNSSFFILSKLSW